jgi:hypothetical protein
MNKKTKSTSVSPKDSEFISRASKTAKASAAAFSSIVKTSVLKECKKSNLKKAVESLL